MNWDQVFGAARQFGGEFKQRLAEILDDDVLQLEGARDVFVGKLQRRSPAARQGVLRQLDALIARVEANKRPHDVIVLP
jgi:uncharacterized protein YjbJ (UPF0337 family)